LTLAYGLCVSFISSFHEVWRDEAHTIGLVKESGSITQLFQNLHNYGHPALWYFLIYAGFQIFKNPIVLKIASIIIAVISVYVFFLKAPFSWPKKVLFALGFFPVYQYSVISRNYGLLMLSLFLFFSLYEDRFKKPVWTGLTLFLMANTIAHGVVLSAAILASWIFEFFWKKNSMQPQTSLLKTITGFSLAFFGILFSVCQIYTDSTTQVTKIYSTNFLAFLNALQKSVFFPGQFFADGLGFFSPFFTSVVIFLIYAYLIRRPFLWVFFFLSVVGLGLFFSLVYPGLTRHQGFLYLVIIGIFWITNNPAEKYNRTISIFLYTFLVSQIFMGVVAVSMDFLSEYSSSKSFARYLKSRAELKDAVVIGEPDTDVESLPYYSDNPIYIVREKRFGNTVRFTNRSKSVCSLGELMAEAQKIKKGLHKPVVIALGYTLNPKGPFSFSGYFKRRFTFSKDELFEFLSKTTKLAEFHGAMKENYDVYLLNG